MSKPSRVLPCIALALSLAMILAGCPSTGIDPDPTGEAVTVTMTVPVNDAVGVAVNGGLSVTFSATMDPDTVNEASFTLFAGSEQVPGTVSCVDSTATFNPSSNLAFSTVFTATITTAVRDMDGNAMIADKIWAFTTGTEPDLIPPSVSSTIPSDSATGIGVEDSITATFSEPMEPSTLDATTFTLSSGAGAVAGAVTYTGVTATFNPTDPLAYSTEYTASITAGVKDLAGNALASVKNWSFTTAASPDTTAPTVTGASPADAATGVELAVNLTATFSEAVDPATVTGPAYAFTLEDTTGSAPVAGSSSLDGLTATFIPSSPLIAGTLYTASISTALEDIAGNPIAAEYSWTFTTAGLRPVMLKSAGEFVILASTGVTVGASTTIHGDIGMNADATGFVGFAQVVDVSGTFSKAVPSTLITGNLYASNYLDPTPAYLATAILDKTAAYNDAAGRPGGTDIGVGGELGGQILAPGLYHWGAAAAITTDLTLTGGPDDIYIFQIGGALTMASAIRVLLPNGALPKNIYWQTVGAVTLGASAEFSGIVLSNAAITLGASAVVNGRLFALTIETIAASASILEPAP